MKHYLMFHRFLAATETGGFSKTMLVGIVLGKILLLLFIFDLILYKKKRGFIYYIRKSVGKDVSEGG